jgi:hypothetical protein
MAWPLLLITAIRLVFAGEMVADFVQHHDRYEAIFSRMTPAMSSGRGSILLAIFLLAALVQPFAVIGLNAALGLAMAVGVRDRAWNRAIMVAVLSVEVLLVCGMALFGIFVQGCTTDTIICHRISDSERWFTMLALSTVGDQSVSFMNLDTLAEIWEITDHGIWLSAAILAVTLAECTLTAGVLGWAARKASRPARK